MPHESNPRTQSIEESLLNHKRIVDTCFRVASFMSEVRDLRRLLTLIMEESGKALDSEASSCMLHDPATGDLYFEVALGEKGEEIKSIRLKPGQGIGGQCLSEGRTLIVNDVANDPRHDRRADSLSHFRTRNLIATPMRYHGKIVGVLEVLNKRGDAPYGSEDARLLEFLADQAAVAITTARLIEENLRHERLAAIGMAVSSIAHHTKNIVMGVKAPVGLIRKALKCGRLDAVPEYLGVIERAARRMEQTAKGMLTFSRQREPILQSGNLNALVREIVGESRLRALEQGVDLRLKLDAGIEDSRIDAVRLHDAILNLICNAIEAHGEAPRPDAFVEVRTRRDGPLQAVEIEDNGPGIAPERLSKIFEPFYTTKGSKGTGLGLAVARQVAEESAGFLTVTSEPNQGTIFTFSLPAETIGIDETDA